MFFLNLALQLLLIGTSTHAREEMKVSSLGMLSRSSSILTKGRTFLITVRGTYSIWHSGCKEDGTSQGVDAYYCYLPLGRCKPPEVNKSLVLGSGGWIKPIYDIAVSNGASVAYSRDHVYRVKLKGTGDFLRASIQDTPPNDNCGDLTITIEEIK